MPNDSCPDGWDLDDETRLCTMCARGYLNISNFCVKCPENYYCPSKNTYEVCQVSSLHGSQYQSRNFTLFFFFYKLYLAILKKGY
jgi:hypothetical protein